MRIIYKKILLVGWLIIIFFISAIFFAPASLLGVIFSKYTNNTFTISNPIGKVWQGRGELVSIKQDSKIPQKISNLKWDINFDKFYQGKIVLFFQTDQGLSSITWHGNFQLDINNLPIPIKLINSLIPRDMKITWNDLNPRGSVTIKKLQGHLANDDQVNQLNVIIDWRDAALDIFPVAPIGDYQIQANIVNNIAELNVKTIKGPLNITGSGRGKINQINLELILSPNPATQEVLLPVLRFWGQPLANNEFSLKLKDLIN